MEKSKLSGARHWLTGSLAHWLIGSLLRGRFPPSGPAPAGQVRSVSFLLHTSQSSSFPSFPVQPASLSLHTSSPDQTSVLPSYLDTSTFTSTVQQSRTSNTTTLTKLRPHSLPQSHFNPHAPQCGLRFRPPINRFLRCPVLSCTTHPAVDYLTSNCILQPPHYSTSTIARTACTKRSTRPSLYDRNEYCPLLSPLSVAQSDPGFNSID